MPRSAAQRRRPALRGVAARCGRSVPGKRGGTNRELGRLALTRAAGWMGEEMGAGRQVQQRGYPQMLGVRLKEDLVGWG